MTEKTARWITVRKPFDYRWESGAITAFTEADLGEHMVKGELADFAVEGGYATEGKTDGSEASPPKPAKKSRRKETAAATTADTGSAEGVGDQAPADADRTDDRPAVDHDAG